MYIIYINIDIWKSNKNVTAVENLEKGIFSSLYYSCKFSEYLKLFQNKCWQPPEDWQIWLVDFKDSLAHRQQVHLYRWEAYLLNWV